MQEVLQVGGVGGGGGASYWRRSQLEHSLSFQLCRGRGTSEELHTDVQQRVQEGAAARVGLAIHRWSLGWGGRSQDAHFPLILFFFFFLLLFLFPKRQQRNHHHCRVRHLRCPVGVGRHVRLVLQKVRWAESGCHGPGWAGDKRRNG